LESKGIDIILGMDWLGKHKVLINCAKKSVKLTTPDGKELEFIAEPVVTAKGIANRAKLNQLDASQGSEVPVVNEFPNVFPEEMPGMPPDRDIEFVIELKPGTAPIYKTPFRMTTLELAELKEHIRELLEKRFICPSSSPWGAPVIFVPKKDGTQRLCVNYRALSEGKRRRRRLREGKGGGGQAASGPMWKRWPEVHSGTRHGGTGKRQRRSRVQRKENPG
jgi:hypothetical protein